MTNIFDTQERALLRKISVKWEAARSLLRRGGSHDWQAFIVKLVNRFSQCVDRDGTCGVFNEIFLSRRSFVVRT